MAWQYLKKNLNCWIEDTRRDPDTKYKVKCTVLHSVAFSALHVKAEGLQYRVTSLSKFIFLTYNYFLTHVLCSMLQRALCFQTDQQDNPRRSSHQSASCVGHTCRAVIVRRDQPGLKLEVHACKVLT